MKNILFISICGMIIFACSEVKRKDNFISKTDTIIIKDSIPYLQTIFVKNSNEDNTILPVDTILEECMSEKAQSTTLGMIECYNKSSEILLIKIKLKEDSLHKFLDSKHSRLLKISQKNWSSFLETEEQFLYKTFYTWSNFSNYPSLGREASIDQAAWKYKIIRDRILALETYYDRIYYKKDIQK